MKPTKTGCWYWARVKNSDAIFEPIRLTHDYQVEFCGTSACLYWTEVEFCGTSACLYWTEVEFHPYAGEIRQPD